MELVSIKLHNKSEKETTKPAASLSYLILCYVQQLLLKIYKQCVFYGKITLWADACNAQRIKKICKRQREIMKKESSKQDNEHTYIYHSYLIILLPIYLFLWHVLCF